MNINIQTNEITINNPRLTTIKTKINIKVTSMNESNNEKQIKTHYDELQQLFTERNRKRKIKNSNNH